MGIIYKDREKYMTNKARLERMDSKKLAKFILDIANDELLPFMDIEKWLKSASEKMCYKAEKRIYNSSDGQSRDCYLIKNYSLLGAPYSIIICDDTKLSVPSSHVM